MLDTDALNKDTLHTVMLQHLYSLNYMWTKLEIFIAMKAPEEYGTDEYYQLHKDFGSYEARRLVKALGFAREQIDDVARYLKHSHWATFENIEIAEVTASSFRMRTIDCSVQRAAKKWGMEHYACRTGSLRIREGFFTGINPSVNVRRVFAPPEARPEGIPADVSCEWLVSL